MKKQAVLAILLTSLWFANCKKPTEIATETRLPIGRGYVISRVGLLLREAPNTKAKVLKTVPPATEVLLISKTDKEDSIDRLTANWYNIDAQGTIGWAYGGYLYTLPVDRSTTVKDIYEDTYAGGTKPTLVILANSKFWLKANSCEYLPEINGAVSKSDNEISFEPAKSKENPTALPFKMTIQKDGSLLMLSEFSLTDGKNEWAPCAPSKDTTFRHLP